MMFSKSGVIGFVMMLLLLGFAGDAAWADVLAPCPGGTGTAPVTECEDCNGQEVGICEECVNGEVKPKSNGAAIPGEACKHCIGGQERNKPDHTGIPWDPCQECIDGGIEDVNVSIASVEVLGAYCKGASVTVTATLAAGQSLPAGTHIEWSGDAAFTNVNGLSATATFNGAAGANKTITASFCGSSKESQEFMIVEVTSFGIKPALDKICQGNDINIGMFELTVFPEAAKDLMQLWSEGTSQPGLKTAEIRLSGARCGSSTTYTVLSSGTWKQLNSDPPAPSFAQIGYQNKPYDGWFYDYEYDWITDRTDTYVTLRDIGGLGPGIAWSIGEQSVASTTTTNTLTTAYTYVFTGGALSFSNSATVTLQHSNKHTFNISRPAGDPYEYKLKIYQQQVRVESKLEEYLMPGRSYVRDVFSRLDRNNEPGLGLHTVLSSKCP